MVKERCTTTPHGWKERSDMIKDWLRTWLLCWFLRAWALDGITIIAYVQDDEGGGPSLEYSRWLPDGGNHTYNNRQMVDALQKCQLDYLLLCVHTANEIADKEGQQHD